MTINNELKIGNIVRFIEGKNDKSVAYTDYGKVILCDHKIKSGFAKIESVLDKGNCFIVTAKHVLKDLYPEIDYDDFIETISLFDYKIGFDRVFISSYTKFEEHQIFAYNLNSKVCITAETITLSDKCKLNSIYIYLPSKSIFDFSIRDRNISYGGINLTVLTASHRAFNALEYTDNIMKNVKEKRGDIKWPKDKYPSLATYEDRLSDEEYECGVSLTKKCLQRLKLDNSKGYLEIFEGCDFLKYLKEGSE